MERVADGMNIPVGRLDFLIKSAHIHEPDLSVMRDATCIRAA
jgi:hypothetical protein